jgi:hypothetical protein
MEELCLFSTFLIFQRKFYEKITNIEMGSPLSPIVVNIFMEKFERREMETYPLNLTRWTRYVYDMNVIWPHGRK